MITIKPINRFKTYKFDAAPFFFFIDIFPPDYPNAEKPNLANLINSIGNNPIMPLPMRVDRVFNGERSILMRPREPVSFPISEDQIAIINPLPFLQSGFEKLLYFTEVRSREQFFLSLSMDRVSRWWGATQFKYAILSTLEEDFSAFLRAYLHTLIKAIKLDLDLVEAAKEYCQLIAVVCEKRMEQNLIIIDIKGGQKNEKMYKIKEATYYKKLKRSRETEYHPELIDIEIYDLSKIGFSKVTENRFDTMRSMNTTIIKYIPLLFYDDLLECMLQNLKRIEENKIELIDPSYLLDKNIIMI
ncbi:MAG: hypothetical protein ACFE8B_10510, partial [Candidatus Hermodarchaeota archaeon]